MKKVGLAAGLLLVKFFLCFILANFKTFGFGTIIDGAKRRSVRAKMFMWVKLVRVKSI